MKIEEGKYYRTRDGRKVGPVTFSRNGRPWATAPGFNEHQWYTQWSVHSKYQGRASIEREDKSDLIAEWTDEPGLPSLSPFVTRRELVPGVYGRVAIPENHSSKPGKIVIHLADSAGGYVQYDAGMLLTADELDEAAHLFAQLAEYLRETK